ncbi:MAG: phosphate acyltransferase PlsX [Clostridia bacterium]|nr:phosphate acyltransferase PlsX [Clostridia bacterium]
MKIAVDCHGGDNSPQANVEGALIAMRKHDDLSVVFVGDKEQIDPLIADCGELSGRIEVIHAPEIITGEERPTDAIRHKKDSSMIRAINLLREDPEVNALVSNGSTGSLVAASTLRIGRIRGIRRPAFCPILPTMSGGIVGVCDSGANVDILPEQLVQFAIMGSRYLEAAFGVKEPKVAMLNIGTETEKGDNLRREAYPMLEKTPGINFVGNMESRDLLTGKYDLVVCDGFAGNVLIKTTEGTALEMLKKLKKEIRRKKRYLVGAGLMKRMFMDLKNFMNYQNYGGSVLLGCQKTVVKGHGSSDAHSFAVCMDQAYRMEKANMTERIRESIAALPVEEETAE